MVLEIVTYIWVRIFVLNWVDSETCSKRWTKVVVWKEAQSWWDQSYEPSLQFILSQVTTNMQFLAVSAHPSLTFATTYCWSVFLCRRRKTLRLSRTQRANDVDDQSNLDHMSLSVSLVRLEVDGQSRPVKDTLASVKFRVSYIVVVKLKCFWNTKRWLCHLSMFQVHVGTLGRQSSSSSDLEDILAETQVTRPWKAGTCMEDLYTKPSPSPASAHSDFDCNLERTFQNAEVLVRLMRLVLYIIQHMYLWVFLAWKY